jgi:cell division protein FtsL
MKKKILLVLLTLALTLTIILAGCSSGSGISQAQYDQVSAQLNTANSQLTTAQTQLTDANTQLTKAQSDLAALQIQKTAVDSSLAQAQASATDLQGQVAGLQGQIIAKQTQITDLQAQVTDLQAQLAFTGATKTETAQKIVAYYFQKHYYQNGVYDCNNMADDVWDMLKAQGITSRIVVGSYQQILTNILQSNHAWVLAEVNPGEYLALDGTTGQSYTRTQNAYYYHGWYFNDPAGVKANDDLRTEYNTRVGFYNTLNNEAAIALNAGDMTLYNKLVLLRADQNTLLTSLLAQINAIATPLS